MWLRQQRSIQNSRQGHRVLLQGYRLGLDHKLQSALEISTAPGIKGEVRLSCRVASCLSLSLPFSSPSIRSCLGFLTVSHPPWPTTSSPAPALAHGVSLPTTGPSLLGCLSSRFQERKRDWLSLSFLVSGAGVLPHPRAHCPSLGFCFHPCHWGDMAQTRTGDCCF